MTRKEIKLALKQFEEWDAYNLRLYLDNRTTVLAHQWFLEEGEGQGGDQEDGRGEGKGDSDTEGVLRVVVGGRQALVAVSRIVLIEMVAFGG